MKGGVRRYLKPGGYVRVARRTLRKVRMAIPSPTEHTTDVHRLLERFPFLRQYEERAPAIRSELLPTYDEYVRNVSSPGMAISLELATFLLFACRALSPERLIDLGSGYSSFVLRMYAHNAQRPHSVWSVDHDQEWLERTRTYLQAHALSTRHLLSWTEFTSRSEASVGPFDLILHDLGGGMSARENALPIALAIARPGAILILDDICEPGYKAYARRLLRKTPHASYSLRRFTRDDRGRYSQLVVAGGRR